MTTVAAYLVHWHAPEWCRESVDALLASDGVEIAVTVVNNGGALDLPPQVRVISPDRNVGYSGGQNIALADAAHGEADYVFIGCHDIRLAPDAVADMAAMLDTDPGLGIVGPTLDGAGGTEPDLEWISGAGWMMRRSLTTWRFDERFSSYAEDLDFCFRIREATGIRVGRCGTAHAKTAGSSHPQRAELLTHANTLAWFWSRRARRLFIGRVVILLRHTLGAVRRRSWREASHHISALGRGLYLSAVFRFQRPDRLTGPRPTGG